LTDGNLFRQSGRSLNITDYMDKASFAKVKRQLALAHRHSSHNSQRVACSTPTTRWNGSFHDGKTTTLFKALLHWFTVSTYCMPLSACCLMAPCERIPAKTLSCEKPLKTFTAHSNGNSATSTWPLDAHRKKQVGGFSLFQRVRPGEQHKGKMASGGFNTCTSKSKRARAPNWF